MNDSSLFFWEFPYVSTETCPDNPLGSRQTGTVGHPMFSAINFISYLFFIQIFTWNSNINELHVNLFCSK